MTTCFHCIFTYGINPSINYFSNKKDFLLFCVKNNYFPRVVDHLINFLFIQNYCLNWAGAADSQCRFWWAMTGPPPFLLRLLVSSCLDMLARHERKPLRRDMTKRTKRRPKRKSRGSQLNADNGN